MNVLIAFVGAIVSFLGLTIQSTETFLVGFFIFMLSLVTRGLRLHWLEWFVIIGAAILTILFSI